MLRSRHELVSRITAMEKALTPRPLSGKGVRKVLVDTARAVEPRATAAARRDLGSDAAFSGWRSKKTGAAIPLKVTHKVAGGGMRVVVHRERFSAGPWRVAQEGRNADGGVGAFQGPGVSLRTGTTRRRKDGSLAKVRRRRKALRWNGRTAGKGTWDKAVSAMEKEARKRNNKEFRALVAKAFKGGR